MNSASLLHRLADKAEIREILTIYCNRLDEYDIDGACAIFTEDVITDSGPGAGGRMTGRRRLVQRLQGSQAQFARTHHQIGQQEILVEGDEGYATTYATAWHQRLDGTRAVALVRYVDRLVRLDGRWSVCDRKTLIAGVEGFSEDGHNWVSRLDPPPNEL